MLTPRHLNFCKGIYAVIEGSRMKLMRGMVINENHRDR